MAASVPAVRVCVVGLHAAVKNTIASIDSTINALAVRDFERIGQSLFDVAPLSLPGKVRGKLKEQIDDGEPGHGVSGRWRCHTSHQTNEPTASTPPTAA